LHFTSSNYVFFYIQPARNRKKNKLYYDEEVMVTPDTLARMKRRIKPEPIEVEEQQQEEDPFTSAEYQNLGNIIGPPTYVTETTISSPENSQAVHKTPKSRRAEPSSSRRIKGQIKIAPAKKKTPKSKAEGM